MPRITPFLRMNILAVAQNRHFLWLGRHGFIFISVPIGTEALARRTALALPVYKCAPAV